jgi:hypothetical protein
MDVTQKNIELKIVITTKNLIVKQRRGTLVNRSLSSISGLMRRSGVKGKGASRSRSVFFNDARSVKARLNSVTSIGGKSRMASVKIIKENEPVDLSLSSTSVHSFTEERESLAKRNKGNEMKNMIAREKLNKKVKSQIILYLVKISE